MATDDEGIVGEELLTKTGSGGLFSSGYLAGEPIESYLDPSEQPRVVFATDGRGIIEESSRGQTTYEPGSDYRTLGALTTRRVVLVVGGGAADDGDRFVEIDLTEIDHVETDSESRRSVLRMWVGDHVWELSPETTDLQTIETYLSAASQTRIRFDRLLGDARDAIVDVARYIRSGQLESAADALDRADRSLHDASEAAESFPADVPAMSDRLETHRDRYRTEQRRLLLARVEDMRARAREKWRAAAYEQAADRYQRASEACETLLDRGDLPPAVTAELRETRSGIERDLDRLSVAPLEVARTYHRVAMDASLPEDRAERFRTAYERYRTVLELDWGRPNPRFAGETDVIIDRLATIASALLTARSRAAAQHRRVAIRLTRIGATASAGAAYADARDHLEAAIETTRELDPDALEAFRERLQVVEDRIESVPEDDDRGGSADHVLGDVATPIRPLADGEPCDIRPVRTEKVLPAVPRHPADGDTTLAVGTPTNEPPRTLAVRQPYQDCDGTLAVPHAIFTPRTGFVQQVQTLQDAALIDSVRTIWEALGWTVERTDSEDMALLGTRPDAATRLRLRIRRRGDPVDPSVVSDLAPDRDGPESDLCPVLVTTDPVQPAAYETAASAGVTIVDRHRLADLWYLTTERADRTGDEQEREAPPPS